MVLGVEAGNELAVGVAGSSEFLLALGEPVGKVDVPLFELGNPVFELVDVVEGAEMVVVEMLAGGAHVERIASALSVHPRTVNRRLDELKRKAEVTTLYQLGAYAARHWLN